MTVAILHWAAILDIFHDFLHFRIVTNTDRWIQDLNYMLRELQLTIFHIVKGWVLSTGLLADSHSNQIEFNWGSSWQEYKAHIRQANIFFHQSLLD